MKNYHVGNSTPEAFISKNKHRVKQFNGTVYLNDGDNFEIELFNPKTTKVLAKISLDGKLISHSGIIVRPGERVFLERYIDSNNKFLFSTYEVNGDSIQVQNAIRSNGDLEVKFYDLQILTFSNVYYDSTITTYPTFPSYQQYVNTYGYRTTLTNCDCLSTTTFSTNMGTLTNGSSSTSTFLNSASMTPVHNKKSIETGTVEKGESSKQDFKYSYDNFNSYTSNIVTWKILPSSQKPVTSNDIKVFCVNCGARKRKNTQKFCPNCGAQFE